MTRTVYVNGAYLPENEATVSIFDRGFLFADGVYEVTSVLDGKLIDFEGHAIRLARSLGELGHAQPDREQLICWRYTVNWCVLTTSEEGLIYLQITRGAAADRDFAYPSEDTPPTIVLFTQNKPGLADSPMAKVGIKVISIADQRWGRRDIKTVQLLYPSMGKMMAKAAGCDDAWMVEDGAVTEGTSNNAYIVKGGKIITRHLVERYICMASLAPRCCDSPGKRKWKWRSGPLLLTEAQGADEAFFHLRISFRDARSRAGRSSHWGRCAGTCCHPAA